MIERQRQIAFGAYGDAFLRPDSHYADATFDFSDPEDGHLWLVDDDRRCEQTSANAVIRDRKGAAAHVRGRELAGTRIVDQAIETLCDVEQGKGLGAVYHGNDESLVAERGPHADVGLAMQLQCIFEKRGVDLRMRKQRSRAGANEIYRQRQARAARFVG